MTKQKNQTPARRMKDRYKRLVSRLARTGPVLLGTITPRTIVRGDPQKSGAVKTYGPYYQWTFKHEGKTVTRNLTAKQAKLYQKAIDNQRNLEQILNKMKNLSLAILEADTVGVIKRKPRK